MRRFRISVFRSNKHIYGQIIDDIKKETLVAASDLELRNKEKLSKTEKAKLVGKLLAEKALKKKIEQVFFDRNRFKYHGRVKALAEGAKEGGLVF